jgi:hypothetical protein
MFSERRTVVRETRRIFYLSRRTHKHSSRTNQVFNINFGKNSKHDAVAMQCSESERVLPLANKNL